MTNMLFNQKNSIEFTSAYNKAREENKETFTYQDGEFVTNYAYYLIQHLINEKVLTGKFEDKIFIPTQK